MPTYSQKSLSKLRTVAEPLQILFIEVIKHVDCTIVCGLRTTEEQQILYAQGRTMPGRIVTNLDGVLKRSRHQINNQGVCTAVDAVPYPIDWDDIDRFYRFGGFVLGIASQMGIELTWGGDWVTFTDPPHFQLK